MCCCLASFLMDSCRRMQKRHKEEELKILRGENEGDGGDGGFGDAMVVVALSLYVIAYQTSFGPCLFTVGAEMFPSLIRGKMMSFQIIFASLSDSSSTEAFAVLLDEFGVTVPFAGHFVFCILGYIFVSKCFVETTEKRPHEIRDELTTLTGGMASADTSAARSN